MIGDKKTVYHSALVREGPVEVTITCDGPIQSKYKGQPDYITLKHNGDAQNYVVENDQCGDALTGIKGQTVTIEATGGRDDADIIVSDDAPPQRKPAPQRQNHERQQPARREPERRLPERTPREPEHIIPARHERPTKPTPEVAFSRMKVHGAKVAVCLRASFLHAQKLMGDLGYTFGKEYVFDDLRALAITHFIETKGSTDITALPTAWIAKEAAPQKQPQKPPPPPPEPEPEPAPEPENDALADEDIPF